MLEIVSYLLGFVKGKAKGEQSVVISGNFTATDDGEGNITISSTD